MRNTVKQKYQKHASKGHPFGFFPTDLSWDSHMELILVV